MQKLESALQTGWRWQLTALISGALLPLSFAPTNFWPVAIVCLAVLAYLLNRRNALESMVCGFLFAVGMFAAGVHWLFVPIYQFSATPAIPAGLLVLLFVLTVSSVYFALPFYIWGRYCNRHPLGMLFGLPAIWVLTEWMRTWLFTGFPWLFLGYGHIDTWLAGWAPITGVIGIGFIVTLSASTLAFCWHKRQRKMQMVSAVSVCACCWLGGLALNTFQWTMDYASPVTVGLAQGNIPQEKKWDEDFIQPTLDRYYTLTNALWGNDWIVWPEAAIPMVANTNRDHARLTLLLADLKKQALANNAALISGILYLSPEDNKAYNSIIATGLGAGIYFKQRLVPFGEYAPLEDWLSGLFNFFHVQRSMIAPGPNNQRGLQVGNAMLAPSICYEIVYPDMVARGAEQSNVLITISNDAWFGNSIGPLQHMQMAQMRSLETQRYLIRGTNNGVSALVNDRGQIIAKTERSVMEGIAGEIELRQGLTPFMYWGSEPIVLLALMILLGLGVSRRRKIKS